MLVSLVVESENGAGVAIGDGVVHVLAGGGAGTGGVARAKVIK